MLSTLIFFAFVAFANDELIKLPSSVSEEIIAHSIETRETVNIDYPSALGKRTVKYTVYSFDSNWKCFKVTDPKVANLDFSQAVGFPNIEKSFCQFKVGSNVSVPPNSKMKGVQISTNGKNALDLIKKMGTSTKETDKMFKVGFENKKITYIEYSSNQWTCYKIKNIKDRSLGFEHAVGATSLPPEAFCDYKLTDIQNNTGHSSGTSQ